MLAHTLKRLGNWHMNVEQPDEAIQLLGEALALFEGCDDRHGIAETLDLLGIANYACANAIDGSRHYERAITLFRALDDRSGELNSLAVYAPRHAVYINNAAVWDHTDVATRLHDGEQAVALARALEAKPAEALALIWPANTLGMIGEYQRALQRVHEGLALAEQIEHTHLLATAHMVLGAVYWDMLFLAEARTHLERALDLVRQSNSLIWLGCIVGYLASTLVQQGELGEARRTLDLLWRADLPMRSHGQRQVWCAQAELALAQHNAHAALSIVERLIACDPHTPTHGEAAIPRLARLRGEALAMLRSFDAAEVVLMAAEPTAAEAPPLLWRLHLARGPCLSPPKSPR